MSNEPSNFGDAVTAPRRKQTQEEMLAEFEQEYLDAKKKALRVTCLLFIIGVALIFLLYGIMVPVVRINST